MMQPLHINLQPWRASRPLSATRTTGEIGLHKDGTRLDIWIRVDGKLRWYAVDLAALGGFLAMPYTETCLHAESDGNAEE